MSESGERGELPRIAVVVTDQQILAMNARPYVRDAFEVITVAEVGGPEQSRYARLLRRLGPVIDSWGKTPEQLAIELAAESPDGIVAIADENVALAAELARRLGLPGPTAATVTRLTDKLAQRAALREHGLRTPRFWAIDGPDDIEAWHTIEREATFPAVLKPRIGTLSRNVFQVASIADAWSTLAAAQDEPSGFLLEEFIPDGPAGVAGEGFDGFLSVESLAYHGDIAHVATTGRAPMAPPFRSGGAFIPSAIDGHLLDKVLETTTIAIRALGVTDGCLHTELKLTPDGPVIIEVNGRMGGKMDELTQRSSGFRFREQQFRIAADLPPVIHQTPVPCHHVGYIVTQQAPQHIDSYTRLTGLEELRELPGVHDITLDVAPGRHIDWRNGTASKLFTVEGAVTDHDQLRTILAACAAVQIVVEQ